MSFSPDRLVTDWTVDPSALLAAGAAAGLYLAGVRRLVGRRRWPPARTAAFLGGVAVVVLATCSGFGAWDTERFTVHAGQHALLGMAAPLLFALGAPVTLALQAVSRPTQVALRRLLDSRAVRALSHPLIGWVAFGALAAGGYFTDLLELSLRHDLVHVALHGAYLAAGLAFLWPLIGVDPSAWRLPHGARLLLVLLAVPFHSFLGAVMVSSDLPLAAAWYTVSDQRTAGGIIWVTGALLGLVAGAIVVWQWSEHDERAATRDDRFAPPTPGRSG